MSEVNGVALVTGASRGIGAAILDRLAAAGGRAVVGTATTEEGAAAITRRIGESGATGRGLVLDLGRPDSVDSCLAEIGETLGTVTVLVNNAGIARDNLLMRMGDEEWNAVLLVNLSSVFALSRRVLRGMLKNRWGRIVNLSSVIASAGNPGQTAYAASKAAIEGFTRSLAQEVGSRNVTVNAVAPGLVDTDMTQSMSPEVREAVLGRIPLGRAATPGDIAGCVAFLCSDDAAYVTGHTLHVNGGLRMG